MKKFVLVSVFAFLLHLTLSAQEYQRMRIPFTELNGLELPADGTPVTVIANCLDPSRTLPDEGIALDNVLNDPNNAIWIKSNGQKVTLTDLIQRGDVSIEGAASDRSSPNPYRVSLINNSHKRIKLRCSDDVQVGHVKSQAADYFGGNDQSSIWANIYLVKFSDLGYISDEEAQALIKKGSLYQKLTKLEILTIEYQRSIGKRLPDGSIETLTHDPTLNGDTKIIREQRMEKEREARKRQDLLAYTKLQKFNSLGYISDDALRSLKNLSFEDKQKKVRELAIAFGRDEGKNLYGDISTLDDDKAFNGDAAAFKAKRLKQDREITELFSKHNIGITGKTPDNILTECRKVRDYGWLTREALIDKIKEDITANVYYLYVEQYGEYLPYLRSAHIAGLLYTKSEYSVRHMRQLEENLFSEKIDRSSIHILNFLSPDEPLIKSTFESLEKLFPDNHSRYSTKDLVTLKKQIRQKKVKFLICLGHFDEGKIVIKTGQQSIDIPIEELYKIGIELGVKVIPLGCESSFASGGKTGTTKIVNSYTTVNKIFESLSAAATLGEFLNGMAGDGKKGFGFVWEFDENRQVLRIRIYDKDESSAGGSGQEGPKGGSGKGGPSGNTAYTWYTGNTPAVTVTIMRQLLIGMFHITNKTNDKNEH